MTNLSRPLRFLALMLALLALPHAATAKVPVPAPAPIIGSDAASLQARMTSGELTSAGIVRAYLDRIAAIDGDVKAIIATFPDALDQARRLDGERAAGRVRGPLHGIPVVLKDNIEVAGLPTTAGSLALAGRDTGRDAFLVTRLRDAGAVILAKTNLSEWANIRDERSSSGWSAVGGLVRNPHDLSRSACGSSSGSGAAVAAGMAPLGIGTETDGSVTCPASINGIVGYKPTVGLVSRTHIVPISHSQDTAGPMTLSVADAAAMLTVMAGTDPADPATKRAREIQGDYAARLSGDGLRGRRLGLMRSPRGSRADSDALLNSALTALRDAGAEVMEIAPDTSQRSALGDAEYTVLLYELKADMAAYLVGRPDAGQPGAPQTLADLIAFNRAHAARELRWFGQSIFELAETKGSLDDAEYQTALATSRRLAGSEGIDKLLAEHRLDALICMTNGPAWTIDLVNGDNFTGPSCSTLPAVAGYPHLTVPMGTVEGLPIGLSFIGRQWGDAEILALGHGYEAASQARVTPTLRRSVEAP